MLVALITQAQNEPMITHFMYHEHVFNPAAAGNARDIHVGVLARQQWIGFKDAPSTQLINAYGYVPKVKGGLGLVVANDMLGKERSFSARFSYAYRQRLCDKAFLSAGISLGLLNKAIRGSELIFQDGGDQGAMGANESLFKPYVGLGLECKGHGLTIGASVTHLDQSLPKATVFRVPRHYFGYAKYDWNASKKLTITPAVFVRSSVFITQADVNVNFTFNKRVVTGLLYRSTDDIGGLLGVYITKSVLLSYSYDFDFGALRTNQSGSHELTLIGIIGQLKDKKPFQKSPRYMN